MCVVTLPLRCCRVEVIGQATGRGGAAGLVELGDPGLEALLAVALVGGLVQRLRFGLAHALALRSGTFAS